MNTFRKNLIPQNPPETEILTQRDAKKTYEDFVLSQAKQFTSFINYLNQYINTLRDMGIITPHLAFYARIKATNSALNNYEHKALDDTFGVEILGTAEEEIESLKNAIESTPNTPKLLKVGKTKFHNKENGYRADHHFCTIEDSLVDILNASAESRGEKARVSEEFPLIEFQFKTFDVYYQSNFGTASHELYKGTKIRQIQDLYDAGNLTTGEYIPTMWVSNPFGNKVRKLSTKEILKKMYPSLVLKEQRENNEDCLYH